MSGVRSVRYGRALNQLFHSRKAQDYYFLPFFRISVAILFLVHWCATWADFHLLYGSSGILATDLAELFKESWIPSFSQVSQLLTRTLGTPEAANIFLFHACAVGGSLLLALGFLTRPSAILLLIMQLIMAKGAYLYAYGIDYFKTLALFYCCVFPVGAQWSVDSRRLRAYGRAVNPTPFRRVLQLHMSIVYFFSGLDKALGYNWWNGEAVWKAVHLPYNKTALGSMLTPFASWPWLFVVMGWIVVLIELCYPAFIFPKRTRILWLMLTVLMHVGIMFFLNLPYFGMFMIALNLSAFLDLSKRDALFAPRNGAIRPSDVRDSK